MKIKELLVKIVDDGEKLRTIVDKSDDDVSLLNLIIVNDALFDIVNVAMEASYMLRLVPAKMNKLDKRALILSLEAMGSLNMYLEKANSRLLEVTTSILSASVEELLELDEGPKH